jgi:hypothetical protein
MCVCFSLQRLDLYENASEDADDVTYAYDDVTYAYDDVTYTAARSV